MGKNDFLDEGAVLRVKESHRNNRRKIVGYDALGKVVIARNGDTVKPGFAKVKNIVEKDKCYIADMENVAYDYYEGIPLPELQQALAGMGFVLEYAEDIDDKNQFLVYANLTGGEMVAIETWGDYDNEYNTIDVYIPTEDGLRFSGSDRLGFTNGTQKLCCFNAVFSEVDYPIHAIMDCSSRSRNWNGHTPNLWHYKEMKNCSKEEYIRVAKKIFSFADNVDRLFNIRTAEYIKRCEEN